MVTVKSNKKPLAFRISDELYQKVVALTTGDNPAYESIAEYLHTVVVSDLARRELGTTSLRDAIIEMLKDEEIRKMISEISREELHK